MRNFFVNENVDFIVKNLGDHIEGITIIIYLNHELQNITVIYRSPTFAISSFLDLLEIYLTTFHHIKGDEITLAAEISTLTFWAHTKTEVLIC